MKVCRCGYGDVQQRVLVAGDAVGAQHVRHPCELTREGGLTSGAVTGEGDQDEGLDCQADVLGRDDRADAFDHAGVAQPLHAPQRGGRGKADTSSELDVRHVAPFLQKSEQRAINLVDRVAHDAIIAPIC